MSEMDRHGDPSVEDLFTGIEKNNAERPAALPAAPPIAIDPPSRSLTPKPAAFTMGGAFKLGTRPPQPADPLEEQARAAMRAAADSIIQPWLYKSFPRIIEQRLGTLVNERVEPMVAALQQQVVDAVMQWLAPVLAAMESNLATAVSQQIAVGINQQV